MICTPPAIVAKIERATGPAHYQHGLITLASGTLIELGSDGPYTPQTTFLEKLRRSDKVQACFVETAAMNGARLYIVENVETKDSFSSVGIPKGGRKPY